MGKTITTRFSVLSKKEFAPETGGGTSIIMTATKGADENKSIFGDKPGATAAIEIAVTNPETNIDFGDYIVTLTKVDKEN